MKKLLLACLVVCSLVLPAVAQDKRLATFKKVFVMPVDDLGVDVPISKCVAKHLPDNLPAEVVTRKEDADVVLKVAGNIPSATTRAIVGMFGGTPSGHLFVELPDGARLWDDGAKLRRAIGKYGRLDSADGDETVECGLADELHGVDRRSALPFQQNRRDRGVRFQSKRTMIARRGIGGNQLPQPGA